MTNTMNAVPSTATRLHRTSRVESSRAFSTRRPAFKKSDIEFHTADFGRGQTPAIDVKVTTGIDHAWREFDKQRAAEGYDAAFTEEWLNAYVCRERGIDPEECRYGEVEEAVGAYLQDWWESACESGLESATNDLEHFFGKTPYASYVLGLPPYDYKPQAVCHLTGRSGGWLYLGDKQGRPLFDREDVAGWDALMVAAWGRFEKACRAYVDDIPYQTLDLVYHNVYLAEQERESAIVAEMIA